MLGLGLMFSLIFKIGSIIPVITNFFITKEGDRYITKEGDKYIHGGS